MKKKIAIIGSTGSIGKNLLEIISNDINDFKINLLTADKDHKTLLRQAKKFNVTNLIIKKNFKHSKIWAVKFQSAVAAFHCMWAHTSWVS